MKKNSTTPSFGPLLGMVLMSLFVFSNGAFAQFSKKEKKKKAEEPSKVALADPIRITSVEGITEYQLANGLKVLMFPDQSKQTITVNITYLVGSRHEGYGETGMAHLLEHMVFKGSTKHPNIPEELSSHGSRPNGTTWLDRTNYFETFAATDENLRWALDLESDRMINSFIKKEDLDKEFSVVRNEFEMNENNPENVLSERVVSTAYLWHNYGNSTIGSREDIERVPIDNLKSFYQKYYQPDNAVLLIAGKFEEAKTLALVNDYFGVIPRPSRKLQATYTLEPTQDGERAVTLRRVGDIQAIGVAYHISPSSHPDYAPIDVLQGVLTNEPAGKLYKSLIETKKASSQYAYSFTNKDPTLIYFGATVLKDKDLDDTKKTMLATLDSVSIMTFTKEDIERSKNDILKNVELLLRNSDKIGMQMSEYIGAGDWRLAFLYRDAVEKVKPEDVMRVAKYYFKPSNRTVGLFIPEATVDRVLVPETPNVEVMVKDYKGKAAIAQGESFDPSPANIENRTTRITEPNGLKLSLLPKSTRGNVVSVNITLRIGDQKSLSNIGTIDNLTASMLNKGTKNLSRQQIKDELDKLKAQVSISGGGSNVNASIQTTRDNLPKALAIVADMLKNPSFDATEFEKLKQEELAGIASQKNDPMALAGVIYSQTIAPYPKADVRYTPTFDEQAENLKTAKLENLSTFHKNFYGASAATISVVGDFDGSIIKKIILDEFGNWKSPQAFSRLINTYQDISAQANTIKTPDKANAMFLAGENLEIKDTDPDYPALILGNYILGGGFLNSRLATRIRQKEGISYGVGSQLSAQSFDKTGTFTTYAIYAPENAEKLEKAFFEELNKVINDGFTNEELKAAKTGWLQGRQVSRAQDKELSSKLNNYLYLGRTMAFDADFDKNIQDLSVVQVNAAMKKYIDPKKISVIKVGDFDKKASLPNNNDAGKAATGSDKH